MPTTAESRARYGVADWATDEDIEEHGALFIACNFRSRAHWRNFKATGDMRHPSSARRQAVLDKDHVRKQREALRKRIASIRRSIADAERKLADAHAALVGGPYTVEAYKAEQAIKDQTARLSDRRAALASTEVDLELFDLVDRDSTEGTPNDQPTA